jgi:hypothetical protein
MDKTRKGFDFMRLIHYNVSNFCTFMKRFELKRQAVKRVGILGLLFLGLGACAGTAPVLTPDPTLATQGEDADLLGHQLRVSIRPVITTGFRSEDRKQFGVDLSAHFTAFYVEIQNGLSREVWVDASNIFLQISDQPPIQAFSESESIEYYHRGDRERPVLILVPKPRKMEKQEIAKIMEMRLKPATLPPGSRHSGLVYFKKIPDQQCEKVFLRIGDVQVEGETDPRQFQFGFNCGG